jgi:hypothetical protein
MAAISGHSGAGIPGYWVVGSDGGIFTFSFGTLDYYYGSMGGVRLNAPIVGHGLYFGIADVSATVLVSSVEVSWPGRRGSLSPGKTLLAFSARGRRTESHLPVIPGWLGRNICTASDSVTHNRFRSGDGV